MTEEEITKKLDTLINLMTPKVTDPNVELIATAEGILRDSLEGKYPKEKLDSWDLKQLKMAKDVQAAKILPPALGKDDALEQEEEEEQTEEKEDALDSPDELFKYSSKTYNKEVAF